MPPEGLYEGCRPATARLACVDRLQKMGNAGFKLVVNGSLLQRDTTIAVVLACGAAAQANGIKVMFDLRTRWDAPAGGR